MGFQKIGIIGLGVIGGSIAKKLKQEGYPVYTAKSKSVDLPKAKNWIDEVFPTIEALANVVDLLILATPMSSIIPIAQKIKADHPLLVIDVGSVKTRIVKEFAILTKEPIEFLSTHPMAGNEKSGFDGSDPDLFQNAPWIIVPHKKNRAKIEPFIRLLGSKPIRMSAKDHDKKTALISHLPMLLSTALWHFVNQMDPEALKIAGPSFRTMTRLARGDPKLLREIIDLNEGNIEIVRKKWLQFLKIFLP